MLLALQLNSEVVLRQKIPSIWPNVPYIRDGRNSLWRVSWREPHLLGAAANITAAQRVTAGRGTAAASLLSSLWASGGQSCGEPGGVRILEYGWTLKPTLDAERLTH